MEKLAFLGRGDLEVVRTCEAHRVTRSPLYDLGVNTQIGSRQLTEVAPSQEKVCTHTEHDPSAEARREDLLCEGRPLAMCLSWIEALAIG